jgi:small subunit ribosomal protein S17
MDKTVVVQVERTVKHPRYGKYIVSSKRIKAHDSGNVCHVGDAVTIRESKPISKGKRFAVIARTDNFQEVTEETEEDAFPEEASEETNS